MGTKTFQTAPCPLLNDRSGTGYKWNFNGKIECPNEVDFGLDDGELVFFKVKGSAVLGSPTITGLRARANSKAAANAALSVRGLYADALVDASCFAKEVKGLFATAQIKAAGNCTTIRAIEGVISLYAGAIVVNVEGARIGVEHPSGAVTVSGIDTLLYLYLDGSNSHEAGSAIYVTTPTAAMKLTTLIDASTANLGVTNTNQVTLMTFKNAAGSVKKLIYDSDNATVVEVI